MLSIIKASLYKLVKDRPFKVTMIVGASLAVLFTLVYCIIIPELGSGYYMLMSSSTPTSNFGIAVPINLVVFIIGEFNYGTIRNKIIAGNKKINIYIALFITGVIFSLSLMFVYIGLSTLLGTIICGFVSEGMTVTVQEVLATIGYTIVVYITLSALSLFAATSIRHIGGAITVTILLVFFGFIAGLIAIINIQLSGNPTIPDYIYIVNPLFISALTTESFGMLSSLIPDLGKAMLLSILSNVIYIAIFLGLGIYIFNYRDVK